MLLLRQEGFSYREIAEVVGVSHRSVGTILARALQRFAAELPREVEPVDETGLPNRQNRPNRKEGMGHPNSGQIQAFIDGELTSGEAEEIQGHMADCGECRTEVRALEAASRASPWRWISWTWSLR